MTPQDITTIGRQLADTLGLLFLPEAADSEVCFANNNAELRDEFKQVISPTDVSDYHYAVSHHPDYREGDTASLTRPVAGVPLPKDESAFWRLVRWGRENRPR